MKQDTADIKERIIRESTRLFAERGFDGISIDEIAREAKVNKSMIYYYFSSKEGLLISLIQRHLGEFEAFIGRVKTKRAKTIRVLVKEIITRVVEYLSANKDIVSILYQETLVKAPKTKIDIITFINPLWDRIERDVRAVYPGTAEATLLDKLLCLSLIISFVLIQNRLEGQDRAATAEMKDLYIRRVTGIISTLMLEHGK